MWQENKLYNLEKAYANGQSFEVNCCLVFAMCEIVGSHAHLEHLCELMDLPTMNASNYHEQARSINAAMVTEMYTAFQHAARKHQRFQHHR